MLAMRTEDSTISLTDAEIEILISSLGYYECRFRGRRTDALTQGMKVLRAKLIEGAPHFKPPAPISDLLGESE